jgi:hypothetical protein
VKNLKTLTESAIDSHIKVIPVGETVVFFHGVKSKKIPEGKIGTIINFKFIKYLNSRTQEMEYAVLYDVRLPDGKVHRTQARCIMRLADWENPSVRKAMLAETSVEGDANQGW